MSPIDSPSSLHSDQAPLTLTQIPACSPGEGTVSQGQSSDVKAWPSLRAQNSLREPALFGFQPQKSSKMPMIADICDRLPPGSSSVPSVCSCSDSPARPSLCTRRETAFLDSLKPQKSSKMPMIADICDRLPPSSSSVPSVCSCSDSPARPSLRSRRETAFLESLKPPKSSKMPMIAAICDPLRRFASQCRCWRNRAATRPTRRSNPPVLAAMSQIYLDFIVALAIAPLTLSGS